ncbi:DNA mismatch repair protein MutS [Candidatus Hepatincola sp. Pdp]
MSSRESKTNLSPMMVQYWEIKNLHQDYILFFRMGDFYEMFYDDAKIASSILGVVLTKRASGGVETEVPMCGVPHHSYESYVNRLIKRGYKVAICEQTETPEEAKKRGGAKAVVNREVKRIMTPGTLMEDSLLESDKYNYLLAIYQEKNQAYLSWIDISTGDFFLQNIHINKINNLLYKIDPKEILISQKFDANLLAEEFRSLIYILENEKFSVTNTNNNFKQFFSKKPEERATLSKGEKIASGVILGYILYTHKEAPLIVFPKQKYEDGVLRLDYFTRRSLEISKSSSGLKESTLKGVLDNTLTVQGSRELDTLLHNPIMNLQDINNRYDVVEFFLDNPEIRQDLQEILSNFVDFERLLGKIAVMKATAKELILLKQTLQHLSAIRGLFYHKKVPKLLKNIVDSLGYFNFLLNTLSEALVDLEDFPINWKEGNFIKAGYDVKLDEIKNKKQSYLQQIVDLQSKYIVKLGISNLKINYNNLQGYYIEVPTKNASKISIDSEFTHKSILSNSVRYTTQALVGLEGNISVSSAMALNAEMDIFKSLLEQVLQEKQQLNQSSKAISLLDVMLSFALSAIKYSLTRPKLDNDTAFSITKGRHLVVEESLKVNSRESFVPNNCYMLGGKIIHLIMGPNMSGKSTFLRQQALIIIMAQVGCFVPAEHAHIGIVDAIFSRVGASDDLFKGQSTFMVEMLELSTILNYATERSFLILDEIGRGTSTYDGLSIAWSSLEYLNSQLKSRTLFATHYHELVALKDLDAIDFYYVDVKEYKDGIIFMHTLKQGVVGKSYGIEVAKLAGLPNFVIQRAKEILSVLEAGQQPYNFQDLPLFQSSFMQAEKPIVVNAKPPIAEYNNIISTLVNLDVDNISAKGALELLYNLKSELKLKKD